MTERMVSGCTSIVTCRLAEFNQPQSQLHKQPSNIQWKDAHQAHSSSLQPKLDRRQQPRRVDRAGQRQPCGAFGYRILGNSVSSW
jgi:hypothetical protein